MRRIIVNVSVFIFVLASWAASPAAGQSRGLEAIRTEDMKAHLEFLAAPEFDGRSAPSTALDIASRYIALQARTIGLKPLLPGGSYFQLVPVEITTVTPAKSALRIFFPGGEQRFEYPRAFGVSLRGAAEGTVQGGLVFLGTVLVGPPADWARLDLPDLKGKIALILDAGTPAPAAGLPAVPYTLYRTQFLRGKGAGGMITIIAADREKALADKGLSFDDAERQRFPDVETGIPGRAPAAGVSAPAPAPFVSIEVRHETGAAILSLPGTEMERIFADAGAGRPVGVKELPGRSAEIGLFFETRRTTTPNVVAWIEGTDSKLKAEYVTVTSHHDHLTTREGRVFPGADDNGSGTVAMFALGRALMRERPKRSVIFVWNTAEERGLIGSYYFVQHCPVSVEKISANLNLDMISRNDPNMIYLIGSNKLSSELDAALHTANDRSAKMKLDYAFESPAHPDQFFFRSDQYPYIRYGIPGVWIFAGTTPDYHTDRDTFERADLAKAEKVTKMVYLALLDIGNKPSMLKLDVNPEITARGPAAMKINWRTPPAPAKK
jgi:hypothetical protein